MNWELLWESRGILVGWLLVAAAIIALSWFAYAVSVKRFEACEAATHNFRFCAYNEPLGASGRHQ